MLEAIAKIVPSDKYAETAEPNARHRDSKITGLFLQTGKAARTRYVEHKGQRTKIGRFLDMSTSDDKLRTGRAGGDRAFLHDPGPAPGAFRH